MFEEALIDLIKQLIGVASQRHGYNQGLLASIFVADALRAGGIDKARLKLGVTEIKLEKGKVGESLSKVWPNAFEDRQKGALTHHVLLFDTAIIDPVIQTLWKDQVVGLYLDGPPPFYGPIRAQNIYQN
jgi:hypothetical protein